MTSPYGTFHQNRGPPLCVHQLSIAIEDTFGCTLHGQCQRQLERACYHWAGVTQINRQSILSTARDHLAAARPHGIAGPSIDVPSSARWDKRRNVTRGKQQAVSPISCTPAFALGLIFFLIHKNFYVPCKVTHQAFSFQVREHAHQLFQRTARVNPYGALRK